MASHVNDEIEGFDNSDIQMRDAANIKATGLHQEQFEQLVSLLKKSFIGDISGKSKEDTKNFTTFTTFAVPLEIFCIMLYVIISVCLVVS